MNRERYLAKSFGDNEEGARSGLLQLIKLLATYNTGVIVVPMLQNLKHSLLTPILGDELTKRMLKDRVIDVGNGKKISLCAQSQVKGFRNTDVFLDLWGQQDSVAEIETLHGWKALILVTWLPKDSVEWAEKYSPNLIYDDGKTA